MSIHFRFVTLAAAVAPLALGSVLMPSVTNAAGARELKVCADPNNLPFSNQREQGFENRLVQLVAKDLHAKVVYVWWAQRRGNIRETLKQGLCDIIPGVASNLEMLATTRPYYRSAYVFVTRADRQLDLSGFDDARLRALTIGVQMVGDDFSNTPPAHALARRGIVENIRGYMLYGDYAQDSPPRAIIEDVVNGKLDVAAVWGPLAGYYAGKHEGQLKLQLVQPLIDGPMLPMVFDVSMGVRKDDHALRRELDAVLERNKAKIDALLRSYGMPLLDGNRLISVSAGPGAPSAAEQGPSAHASATHSAPGDRTPAPASSARHPTYLSD
jgi:mxaJ protein